MQWRAEGNDHSMAKTNKDKEPTNTLHMRFALAVIEAIKCPKDGMKQKNCKRKKKNNVTGTWWLLFA